MSIWSLPLATANTLYTIAYAILVVGAIATGIATMLLFWTSAIRDKFANIEIADLKVKAETAVENQLQLKKDSLQIEENLEKERTARLNLEQELGKLKPRRLTSAQVDSIRGKVGRYWAEPLVGSIAADLTCSDCAAFASQIANAIQNENWKIVQPAVMGPSVRPAGGLTLRVPDKNSLSLPVSSLVSALEENGYKCLILEGLDSFPFTATPNFELTVTAVLHN